MHHNFQVSFHFRHWGNRSSWNGIQAGQRYNLQIIKTISKLIPQFGGAAGAVIWAWNGGDKVDVFWSSNVTFDNVGVIPDVS
jgi:hypothetical protein